MIIACIIAMLLLAFIGSFFNYLGWELMVCAFELSGGSAIGLFSLGVVWVLVSLVAFVLFTICGQIFIKEIKYWIKGGV